VEGENRKKMKDEEEETKDEEEVFLQKRRVKRLLHPSISSGKRALDLQKEGSNRKSLFLTKRWYMKGFYS
jgi:hypothetical protein